jgi:hypothetical protein
MSATGGCCECGGAAYTSSRARIPPLVKCVAVSPVMSGSNLLMHSIINPAPVYPVIATGQSYYRRGPGPSFSRNILISSSLIVVGLIVLAIHIATRRLVTGLVSRHLLGQPPTRSAAGLRQRHWASLEVKTFEKRVSAQPSGSNLGGSFNQALNGSTSILSTSVKGTHSNNCMALTIGS